MSSSRLTVVVPAYQAERFLGATIDSVLACGEPNVEVMVVDDGSTDGTRQVAQSHGARYIYQTNQRQAAARRNGLHHVDSPFVAFLDHDDLYMPAVPTRLVEMLERRPDVVCAFADAKSGNDAIGYRSTQQYITASAPGFWTMPAEAVEGFRVFDPATFRQMLLTRNLVFQGAAVMRTAELKATAGFDSSVGGADDWLCALRLSERGRYAYLDEYVAIYTRHDNNITNDYEYMVDSFARARRIYLDTSTALSDDDRRVLSDGYHAERQFHADLAFGRGDYGAARKRYRAMLTECGISKSLVKGLLLSHLPAFVVDGLRRWKSGATPRVAD